jgi:chorismate dehydratase
MAKYRVGCVPFVNARPLVEFLDPELVEVVFDVPSKLPPLLDAERVEAILVSSVEYLRRDDLEVIAEPCIASFGPVASVRLLSKVSLADIRSLALDSSSMTSNLLAQVILAERGVHPTTGVCPPNTSEMLESFDACVIIGDLGYEAAGDYTVDLDLGQAWTEMTGLPFIWAMWLCRQSCAGSLHELGGLLDSAFQASGFGPLRAIESRIQVIANATKQSGWGAEKTERYLTESVVFEVADKKLVLDRFKELLEKHKLL